MVWETQVGFFPSPSWSINLLRIVSATGISAASLLCKPGEIVDANPPTIPLNQWNGNSWAKAESSQPKLNNANRDRTMETSPKVCKEMIKARRYHLIGLRVFPGGFISNFVKADRVDLISRYRPDPTQSVLWFPFRLDFLYLTPPWDILCSLHFLIYT